MPNRLVYPLLAIVLGGVTVNAEDLCVSGRFLSIQQVDKKTEINANLRQAKYMMDHNNNYVGAKKKLERVLELDPTNEEANTLIAECKIKIEQIKKKEKEEFQEVCKKNTMSALRLFIDEHPNSEFRKEAEDRIKDFELWHIAKEKNTIESYNSYIQNSTFKAYKTDAQAAIKRIQEEQSWNTCKDSENEDLLAEFIREYPESPNINEAKYRINLVKGERMYKDGVTEKALLYLSDANMHRTLTGEAAAHYAELKDKKTFNEMLASSDIEKVRKYLNTLSFSSPYYNDTSNHLALLLGAQLSAWSSEYDMNEALSFAKDEPTRATVNMSINQAKDLHRTYERQRKASARKAWWKGRVTLGWNIMNLGTTLSDNNNTKLNHIGSGFRLRFGRYSDVVNIILGTDYQYYLLKTEDYQSSDFGVHQGIGIANLRFNLWNAFSNAKFYVGCAGDFTFYSSGNDVPNDALNKSSIAIEPQMGIQGKGLDIGFYYRTFTDKNGIFKYDMVDNDHGGLFFTWYF